MKRLCFLTLGFLAGSSLFATYYRTPYFPGHENCSHFYMEAEVGDYRLGMPSFTFGQILSPPLALVATGPIEEFTIDGDRVDCFYPRLALGVEFNRCFCPCWVRNLLFEVAFFYTVGDRQDTPGDGVFSNFALPDITGEGDFIAGLGAVPTAFSGLTFKRAYRYAGVQFKLGSDLNLSHSRRVAIMPFVELDLDSITQDYDLRVGAFSGGADFVDFALNEHVITNYIDFGIGLDVGFPFSPTCKTWVLFGEGAVFISGAHTRLKATEFAIDPVGPTSFDSLYRIKHDALHVKARGQVGIGYQFGYNFMASIIGQVDYWGYLPQVINPQRVVGGVVGAYDRAVHVESTSTVNYALLLSLTVTFF